jgi:hypothetical protein
MRIRVANSISIEPCADNIEIDQRGRCSGILVDSVGLFGGRLIGQWALPSPVRSGRLGPANAKPGFGMRLDRIALTMAVRSLSRALRGRAGWGVAASQNLRGERWSNPGWAITSRPSSPLSCPRSVPRHPAHSAAQSREYPSVTSR